MLEGMVKTHMPTPQLELKQTPVRESVSKARQSLNYVAINEEKVERVATEWAPEEFELPAWQAPVFPDESSPDTSVNDVLDFLFIGNSINFAFRDFKTGNKFVAEYDGLNWAGAFGMWACLKRAYDQDVPILDGKYLSTLSKDEVETLFDPAGDASLPMLNARHQILRDIGDRLEAEYEGRFHNFIADCPPLLFAEEEEGIVDRLVKEFPSYNDSDILRTSDSDIWVYFHKRAQLAPAMAYGRFCETSEFELNDPAGFTVFADYNLPNVLRHLGVLEYDSELRSAVDNQEVIKAGSRKEVELRVATIASTDLIMEELNKKRQSPVYGPHLDYKLFSLRDNVDTPVHKTRTTAY